MCTCVCVCACTHVCVHACLLVCMGVWVCACAYLYMSNIDSNLFDGLN